MTPYELKYYVIPPEGYFKTYLDNTWIKKVLLFAQ